MTIIIGLNEDNKNNITLGIVAKDVLIEDAENKEKYATKMSSLKQDLEAMLGKDK